MRIGIDIMGGDYAPEAALKGINEACTELTQNITLVLIGEKSILRECHKESCTGNAGIEEIPTTQVIGMGESPTKAFTQKQDSSISKGFQLLKKGEVDVFLSAGNTGAMLVGSLYTIKAIEGVIRPSITTLIPKVTSGYGILLDIGANADCKQDVLLQFGILGSLYAKYVHKKEDPKVGLLNIGSEPEKGNLVTQAAFNLMNNFKKINFIGNVEGYDLFNDKSDVIVSDGFTGNIVLKTAEAIYEIMKQRNIVDAYFAKYDYENYGGTPILGVNKPVVIGHGVSSPTAFKNMIFLAKEMVDSQLIDKIKLAFEP